MKRPKAFTLVELSVVVMIIGLVISAIFAGGSIMNNARLATIMNDFTKYNADILAFYNKYKYLPGDMPNATQFWYNATSCPGTTYTTGNCNGNSDGIIGYNTTSSLNEVLRAWQHMNLAGMLAAPYNGPATYTYAYPGTNVPTGRVGNSCYSLDYNTYFNDNNGSAVYDNRISFGTMQANANCLGAVLSVSDAYNLDLKFDDGKPLAGDIIGSSNASGCASTTSQFTAAYNFATTGTPCLILYNIQLQ